MNIIKGEATLLFNAEGLHLEIRDDNASIKFLDIHFDEKQTCQLLSRRSNIHCDMEIYGLDRIGKKMEWDKIEFEIPENINYKDQDKVCYEKAKEYCLQHLTPDWEPDLSFNSQDSFFRRDNKDYARCTVRKWV